MRIQDTRGSVGRSKHYRQYLCAMHGQQETITQHCGRNVSSIKTCAERDVIFHAYRGVVLDVYFYVFRVFSARVNMAQVT
jgi:hypothetical protein